MFLIGIDFMSKFFKILFDESSGFVGARLFHHFQNLGFQYFYPKIMFFKHDLGFLGLLEVSWCPQRYK